VVAKVAVVAERVMAVVVRAWEVEAREGQEAEEVWMAGCSSLAREEGSRAEVLKAKAAGQRAWEAAARVWEAVGKARAG
jgi:hypothetical protein